MPKNNNNSIPNGRRHYFNKRTRLEEKWFFSRKKSTKENHFLKRKNKFLA